MRRRPHPVTAGTPPDLFRGPAIHGLPGDGLCWLNEMPGYPEQVRARPGMTMKGEGYDDGGPVPFEPW